MRILMSVLLVALILTTAGCCRTQQGALIGGAAGAGTGGGWAAASGSTTLTGPQGALVGAAAGGVVGALVGDQLEHKSRKDLAAENENLKMQIEAKNEMLDKANRERDDLRAQLEKYKSGKTRSLDSPAEGVSVEDGPDGMVYTILERILFNPGSAEITEQGQETLKKVAEAIKKDHPNKSLNIEGHTDNVPITYSPWKSNWELGSARAMAILHFLESKKYVKGAQLSATTFGQFQPREPNDSPENRAYNRRAAIVVKPR